MFKNYFFSNLSTTNANYVFVNDTFLGANKKIKDMEVLSEPWFVWSMCLGKLIIPKNGQCLVHYIVSKKPNVSIIIRKLYHLI